jgi:hypothetical protein
MSRSALRLGFDVDADAVVYGSGTLNYIPKWTPDSSTLGDSAFLDDGTDVFLSQPGGAPYRTFFMGVTAARSHSGGHPWLWIYSAAVGYAPNIAGNDLVIESSTEPGITLLGTPTTGGYIYFQDAINANTTKFGYNHNTDEFEFIIAGNSEFHVWVGGAGLLTNNYLRWFDSADTDYMEMSFNNTTYFAQSQTFRMHSNDASYGDILVTGGNAARCGFILSNNLTDSNNKTGAIKHGSYDTDEEPYWLIGGFSYNGGNECYIGYSSAVYNCATAIRLGVAANQTTLTGTELMLIWTARFDITALVPFRFARLTTAERNALSAANGDTIFNTTTTKLECYDGATWQACW